MLPAQHDPPKLSFVLIAASGKLRFVHSLAAPGPKGRFVSPSASIIVRSRKRIGAARRCLPAAVFRHAEQPVADLLRAARGALPGG